MLIAAVINLFRNAMSSLRCENNRLEFHWKTDTLYRSGADEAGATIAQTT